MNLLEGDPNDAEDSFDELEGPEEEKNGPFQKKRRLNETKGNPNSSEDLLCHPPQEELYIPDIPLGLLAGAQQSRGQKKTERLRTLCVRGLPEWTDEGQLRNLFTQGKRLAADIRTGNSIINEQCVTRVEIVRDPVAQKCIGYAYVEFTDHETASDLLETLAGPEFQFPGSNKHLSLCWAQGPVQSSSVLEDYHFYIGNIQPNINENGVAQILREIHPSVLSVRLLPTELLGPVPIFYKSAQIDCESEEKARLAAASTNFYRGARVTSTIDSDKPKSHTNDWMCGFIRIRYEGKEWKGVLRDLRIGVNGDEGIGLRREVKGDIQATAITIRPIFGNFPESNPKGSTPSKFGENRAADGPVTSSTQPRIEIPIIGQPSRTTVFVGNLADDTIEDDLRCLFSPFGKILSIRVIFLKHVAFIEFTDHRSALASLSHLRGATLKKAKIYFDWGRIRARHLGLPRNIELESIVDHADLMAEKTYATEWIQSMRPEKQRKQVSKQKKMLSPHDPPDTFWLASLCASLPTRPSHHVQGNDSD